MAVTFNDKFATDLLAGQGIADQFPAGSILEIRTGAAPGVDAAATGTALATITIPSTPWGTAASRSIGKNGTWQDIAADATGTAAHFRLRTSGDANGASGALPRYQGSITATGGGGDMTLDNVSIAINQQVTITSFNITD